MYHTIKSMARKQIKFKSQLFPLVIILLALSCKNDKRTQAENVESDSVNKTEEVKHKPDHDTKVKSESTWQIIGKWYDNSPYIEHGIIISEKSGNYRMELNFKDGSNMIKTLYKTTRNGLTKFTYDNPHGEYLIVQKDGSLSIYDNEGFIKKAEKVSK